MNIQQFETPVELGIKAAQKAESLIVEAIAENGQANIILATGTSQFETLKNLIQSKKIDWSKVNMFHLDEYLGISENHPASFCAYLQERFVRQVKPLKSVHFISGSIDVAEQTCRNLGAKIEAHPIDVALIGIGENGHLAFNDPPADLDTKEAFIIVELDEACRQQQLGEGWFPNLEAVPERAISMSIAQILKSKNLIVSVPDRRKANAVQSTVLGPVNNTCPASTLQTHPACDLYLDKAAASLL